MSIFNSLNDESFGKFCVELIEKDYDEKTKERLKEIRKRGPKKYNLPKAEVGFVDEGEVDFLLDAMDEAKNKFREQKEDA